MTKLFFDGGCRPNPGAMETAVFARGVAYHEAGLGDGTNDDAEWLALLHALRVARALAETDVTLIGDSRLVVNQANSNGLSAKSRFQVYFDAYRELAAGFERIQIRHVPRSKNLAGAVLERVQGRL